MISGEGKRKTLFLNLFKEGGYEDLQFSSVIIVADMFQIILVVNC